jgi:single-stranded DNA-specific DHH superfamily exonuclease
MTPDLPAAREAFARFVESLATPSLVFHDADADGVTAGVILEATLQRLGFPGVERQATSRERDAWGETNRTLIRARGPRSLFVLDLGSRAEPLIDGPSCFIDHHRPDGVPPNGVLITAYAWKPIPNTSLLVYDVCSPLAKIDDLEWIAAVGVISDLGERAPFGILGAARQRYAMKDLKEVTTLVNAARRASEHQPEVAARALAMHSSPRDLLTSSSGDVARLRALRDEVKSEIDEAKKAAPKFAGNVALIRVRSRCQVHPVIAQIWRTRLPKYIVIVANDGYVEGRVNFSMRAAPGTNLLDYLAAIDLGEGEGSYGRGHDQATGGSLPFERWELFLSKIGFA